MSGHSKWATIKRAKAVTDAKRGAIFTRLGNAITIAAREKGGDLEANPSLRMAVDKAKSINMPKDNIERAIKRGTGELAGDIVEELYYEGVLPNNVQIVIKCLTDNKNRSAATVRHALSKFGGSLGSVMWNFEQKGLILLSIDKVKEKNINIEELELEMIEVDIEDFKIDDESLTIVTKVENLQKTKKILEDKELEIESAEIEYVAKDKNELSEEELNKLKNFLDILDENEDVNSFYLNVDF
ncbi:MAG: YebC/PmpR family DNA-binding transcriptional regulator [Patescibacteria group bacterium]